MKYLALFLTALFAVFTFSQAKVVELTDENFGDLILENDEWLIDFYADWCGYCTRLAPVFNAADRLLSMSTHKHTKLGVVNVETNPGLSARFFVSRLPTIVHIKDHEVRVLKPTQKENDIVAFVTEERWRDVEPKSNLISPFSLFGKMVGFVGKMIKKLSGHSPWTLIGVLTGFLVFAISLPVLLNNKTVAETDKKKEVKASPTSKRKSKRID
ncbi:hypothetical protein INT48_001100 [Thamnidium elegans]|uniref:Thioredoxin domain-containing protein n=1 Tax=Thamnidium elegans TaxID=101142 RepID=A0A8H7VS82_9FUNG|nr:hypothetical protein INT48_001100 [Thamnidium elegans]